VISIESEALIPLLGNNRAGEEKINRNAINQRKNYGRCQNKQQENKHYVKIVTTHRLHSQPPHDPSISTLSKVNI
jgi:hypothetical protein